MSLRKKLQEAASAAALEATLIERHRCCWALQQVLDGLKAQLDTKLLTAAQAHLVGLRVGIAESVVAAAKAAILSGERPPPPQPKEAEDGTQSSQGRPG